MADATKKKETPSSFTNSFAPPVLNISATTPMNLIHEGPLTNQQGSSAASVSFLSTICIYKLVK